MVCGIFGKNHMLTTEETKITLFAFFYVVNIDCFSFPFSRNMRDKCTSAVV